MKRCKDCKWFMKRPNRFWADHCWRFGRISANTFRDICYRRKWWKFWRPK